MGKHTPTPFFFSFHILMLLFYRCNNNKKKTHTHSNQQNAPSPMPHQQAHSNQPTHTSTHTQPLVRYAFNTLRFLCAVVAWVLVARLLFLASVSSHTEEDLARASKVLGAEQVRMMIRCQQHKTVEAPSSTNSSSTHA